MTNNTPAKVADPMSMSLLHPVSFSKNAPGSPDEIEVGVAPTTKIPRQTAKNRVTSTSKLKNPKIRTYMRRKTEIKGLTNEMKRLKKLKEHYKYRNEVLRQRVELMEREVANKSLREVLDSQRLSFASTMSMVTQFFCTSSTEPFDLPARLSKDPSERHTALLKMKTDRLQVGHHFMSQRQHYQSTSEFCDKKKFEAPNGDVVSSRFEILPLPGARSVKAIIDALQIFVYNLEINISDAVGDVTIRENDDAKLDSPLAQHRLVSTVANVVQTDTNNVAFAEYRPSENGDEELGLMICDAVDEDELFPYQSFTRVRQDMTQITFVAWHREDRKEPIIVMTRWWCLRIRKNPNINVPPFVVERIRTGVDKVGEAMLLTAKRAAGLTL